VDDLQYEVIILSVQMLCIQLLDDEVEIVFMEKVTELFDEQVIP
jgi:hypothetical protein